MSNHEKFTPECGDHIWVIDREGGAAVGVSCVMFLARSPGFVVATAFINDLDVEETIQYHIRETQDNIDTDLLVYPEGDCFLTKEVASDRAMQEMKEEDTDGQRT